MKGSRHISKSRTGRIGTLAFSSGSLRGEGTGARSRGVLTCAFLAATLLLLGGTFAQRAAAACTNESLRTEIGANLPDCRAYEQVTPVDKNGGYASGIDNHVVAAQTGPGLTFYSANGTTVPGTGNGSTADFPTFLATRGTDSWSSRSLLPPQPLGEKGQFLGITPDLRYDVVQALNTNYFRPESGRGLYLIDTATEIVTTIVPPQYNEEEAYAFDGADQDGSRIFFESRAAIPTTPVGGPLAIQGSDNLYMWERATGQISLVGLLPQSEGGEVPPSGAFGGAYNWYGENTGAGGALGELAVGALHAISPSGDQIYFTAAETGQLYLRSGLTGGSPSTVRISEPNTDFVAPSTSKPAAFQEATPAGTEAFFLSSEKLTKNATTGSGEAGKDLYRYDASGPAGQRLIDITPDSNTETPNGADVRGLLGASGDGQSGFFVARGVLGEGAEEGAEPGLENLYRFEISGSQVTFAFVAVLGPAVEQPIWAAPTARRASRVSNNGNVVVFTSAEPLTGYSNESIACTGGEIKVGPCSELFRYEASSANLTCLSCSQTGAPPAGSATFSKERAYAKGGQFPGAESAVVFTRNMSEDGSRVYFETPQALVPGDTNGDAVCGTPPEGDTYAGVHSCQDVYEWEAVDTPGGSCAQVEINGGCVYLLSSGQSDRAAFFAGASRDGSNVYLLTTARLTPSDTDVAPDFYDASIGGGLPSQHVTRAQPCVGEGCLPAAAPASPSSTPGSAQFHGPGNRKVHHKKKHHKRKHHKRHHKRKHHSKQAHHSRKPTTAKSGSRRGQK